jgi:hypothetical protein
MNIDAPKCMVLSLRAIARSLRDCAAAREKVCWRVAFRQERHRLRVERVEGFRAEPLAFIGDGTIGEIGAGLLVAVVTSGLRLNPLQVVGFDLLANRHHVLARKILVRFAGSGGNRSEEFRLPWRGGHP